MIDEQLTQNFGRIWPQHGVALTQFWIACRRSFEGDLDLFSCSASLETGAFRHDTPRIPRETVRRKLNVLVEKGWVSRDEIGYITATEKAKQDLAPLTMASLVYLTRMKRTLSEP